LMNFSDTRATGCRTLELKLYLFPFVIKKIIFSNVETRDIKSKIRNS
jgi:hypothetical protein